MVREFEEERTRRLLIVVDTEHDEGDAWTPLDRSCAVAASLVHAAVTAGHGARLAAATRDDQALLEAKNHESHRQINLMADKRKLTWVLHGLTRYVPHHFYSQIHGWSEATVTDRGEILESIRRRDPEAAIAMQDHVARAGELLAAHFERPSADGE